jgi:hypothetical protein
MRPKAPNFTTKIGYLTRGKVHLIHPQSVIDLGKTWCGLSLADINNSTLEMSECTCQRCLMYATKPVSKTDHPKKIKAMVKNITRMNRQRAKI